MELFGVCSVHEGCRLVFFYFIHFIHFTLFSVCSVYEACRLVCLLYLFIYLFFFIVWRGVAFRVPFMGHWGGALVASTAFVAFMRRLGWSPFCGI